MTKILEAKVQNSLVVPTTLKTKSSIIRFLSAEGKTRSEIVKYFKDELKTPILYQHVRNVLITPIKNQK